MAPFALLSGRRLAQFSELASPLVGNSVSARTFLSSQWIERELGVNYPSRTISVRNEGTPISQIPQLPSATAGLIGFICFLAAIILVLGGWKVIGWRRRKESQRTGLLPTTNLGSEKHLRPLVLVPPLPLSPSVRWVPAMISPWFDPRLPQKPSPSLAKDAVLSQPAIWSFGSKGDKASDSDNSSSDPSSYPSSADSSISIIRSNCPTPVNFVSDSFRISNIDVDVVHSEKSSSIKSDHMPLPPGIGVSEKQKTVESTRSSLMESSHTDVQADDASPTTSSDSDLATSECSSVVESQAQQGFPKLVIVKRSFAVNLPDELKISEGERLRVLREFKDGWALCQRVSRRSAEKGAVPTCCLADLTIDTVSARRGKRGAKSSVDDKD